MTRLFHIGAQNDALYIISGDAPALNNDYPRHDADRTCIAKVFDEAEAKRLVEAANSSLGGPSERDSLWNLLGQCETIAASGGSATHCVEMIRAALKPQLDTAAPQQRPIHGYTQSGQPFRQEDSMQTYTDPERDK
jgi:hypothetical protein